VNSGAAFSYDAAGDVTNDGANQYIYDAEGRLCAVNTRNNPQSSNPAYIGYIYDAAGIRVAKGTLSSFSCNFATNGFAATTSWALGQGGEQDFLYPPTLPVDQKWYVNTGGKNDASSNQRIQLVVGMRPDGTLIKSWTDHVNEGANGPVFRKIE
jgi:YD repeat-containing protein